MVKIGIIHKKLIRDFFGPPITTTNGIAAIFNLGVFHRQVNFLGSESGEGRAVKRFTTVADQFVVSGVQPNGFYRRRAGRIKTSGKIPNQFFLKFQSVLAALRVVF
jgi:hypothetical protein